MPRILPLSMTFALCVLAGPACGGDPTRVAPPTRIPDAVEATPAPGAAITTSAMPSEVRRAVVDDAARRFNVAASAVVLTRAEQVTWSDGALGCPQPGMMYTQALVPGYRVIAKSPAGELTYHTDSRGNVVRCTLPPGPAKKVAEKLPSGSQPQTSPPPRAPDR